MELSFPKKSYFKQSEVLELLGISLQELRAKTRLGLKSFFNENGKKIYLRECIVELYVNSQENRKEKLILEKEKNHSQLFEYRDNFRDALSLISQIKNQRSQTWLNL